MIRGAKPPKPPPPSTETATAATVERVMRARLGRSLYWLCCALAGVALVAGVFPLQHDLDNKNRWMVYLASVGGAVVCWLLGRACKYYLAGE